MCGLLRRTRAVEKDDADELARLLNRELGCEVTGAGVKRLLRYHWSKVSGLAHAIHEDLR